MPLSPAYPPPPQHHRYLPAWEVDTLPVPPPTGLRNFLKIIGPGAILLGMAIGSGEWLLGPAAVVRYGTGLLVVVTLSILLQLIINTEAVRYTLYSGEPIFTGFLRTRPGPRLWGPLYLLFTVLHQGWPGWAATSAAALFAGLYGALPSSHDLPAVRSLGYLAFAAAVFLLLFGRSVQRTLEFVSWFMLFFIFSFLVVMNLLAVSAQQWWLTTKGFLGLGEFLTSPDWFLLAALVPYAGNGGVGNLVISNWARDKGFGMGARVGAIASAVGGRTIRLSAIGKVFLVDETSRRHWRGWWQYVRADQYGVWAGGCFLGMFLTCNLTAGITPPGTDLQGLGVGAYQAHYLAQQYGPLLWHLTLLNGFWILFHTQLSVMDSMCRLTTDVLWTASPRVRRLSGANPSRIYYTLLFLLVAWGCVALQLTQPLTLVKLGAVNAGFISAFSAVHILMVNRRLLPEPLRPPRWRQVGLLLCTLFYGFFIVQWLRQL